MVIMPAMKRSFAQVHVIVPVSLLKPADEQAWREQLPKKNINSRISAVRRMINEAYELWRQRVQYAGPERGEDRIKLYSDIQGASIAAQSIADYWKYVPEVPEGNDIAVLEHMIAEIIKRPETPNKEEWRKAQFNLGAMFNEDNPDSIMWFVKDVRYKRSQDPAATEQWLRNGIKPAEDAGDAPPPDESDQRTAFDIDT